MAKPELEDGYTQIANEILEKLARVSLSPNQWRVLLLIIRKTYGFHKKVDYIANFQIVEATGLCKAVVSRCLKGLNDMKLITRRGKYIGFQKDWERWSKLAVPSTLDTKLAEQSTSEKLAVSSTELAIPSTKVSSRAVTQKIKNTISKNKGTAKKRSHPVIEEIYREMRSYFGYPDEVDIDPIPYYGKEGQAIKRMLTRGFTAQQILDCWKGKCNKKGRFVSMVYVGEDIRSKPSNKNALQGIKIEG